MNINCSLCCAHQKNGKCSLKELEVQRVLIGYGAEGTQCPYYKKSDIKPK